MHEIKKRNFAAAHPDLVMPVVEPVPPQRASELRNQLAARLRVSPNDGLLLVRTLASRAVRVATVDASAREFRFTQLLWRLKITAGPFVYLNWERFDGMDKIRVEALTKYFDDLWYPASDDLDVFDDSCDWVISVAHSGSVSVARLKEPS